MMRVMGSILLVLAFAMVARADRIAYEGDPVAPHIGDSVRDSAMPVAAVETAILVENAGTTGRDWSGTLSTVEKPAGLKDDVFSSQLNEPERAFGDSAGFEFIRGSFDDVRALRGGRGDRFGIEHPEPYHRSILGVQDVSEPGTLLLMGIGLGLVAVGMRRRAV